MKSLRDAIGPQVASDDRFRAKMRFHQGWWRTCVLAVEAGPRKGSDTEKVCSMAPVAVGPEHPGYNFLTSASQAAVDATLGRRGRGPTAGIVDEVRLRRNLLSSQPLAFNFFGHMAVPDDSGRLQLANLVLPGLFDLGEVVITRILFEFAGSTSKPIGDNTAFDVAVEYTRSGQRGLVGIECKYTEPFSKDAYRRSEYEALFERCGAFAPGDYQDLSSSRYNQLLRTHLLAQALREGQYDEVHTCLFSSEQDDSCRLVGRDFLSRVKPLSRSRFLMLSFADFIAHAQRQELGWPDREWTMRLWARYCATGLSEQFRDLCGRGE